MRLKYRFLLFILVVNIACPCAAMSMDKDDFQFIETEIKKYKRQTILIPEIEIEQDDSLEMLFQISNKEKIDLELYDEDNIKEIADILDENKEYEKILEKFSKSKDILSLINKASTLLEITSTKANLKIKESIYSKQKKINDRLYNFFESFSKMSFEENQIFFIVFPEAFFNYFKHPNGIGDFIPSSFEEIKDFLEFSKKFKNIIFIPNIIYMDNLVKKNTFEKNFKTFGNHSYTQTKIIGLYDKYKDDEDIIPIFNETFVLFNGEILKSYKKQYILDQDIPIFTSENKSSYVIWDEKCMYIPGLENQINSTTLAIEICQDHYRLPIDQTPKSRMLIVQSATINLRSDLKNNYSGICIHADILKGSSSCLKIEAQKEKLITPKNIKFDIYNIKRYDIEY